MSSDDLYSIADKIKITPELFTVRDEPTPALLEGIDVTLPKFDACGTQPTSGQSDYDDDDLSRIYVTDCLYYPIYSVVVRNNNLMIQLDTSKTISRYGMDDNRMMNAGYYLLTI